MGRILAVEYLTLDGVFEDPTWTRPYFDAAVGEYQGQAQGWADALLMGRVTYEGMSGAWPAMGDDPATGAAIMNSIGKYVPTSTLSDPEWNATFLSGDVVEEVTRLTRDEDKKLLLYGSGQLSETLREAGLIDEYRLLVCPIVLGAGRRLFAEGTPSTFTVARSQVAPGGMIMLDLNKA